MKENYAHLSIDIDERHLQLIGVAHGWVIASLADSASARAVYGQRKGGGAPVTGEIKINFFKPLKSGRLVAKARNLHKDSKIFCGSVDVGDAKHQLIAKSLVPYYLVTDKPPVESSANAPSGKAAIQLK